jgi:hypothetical protein
VLVIGEHEEFVPRPLVEAYEQSRDGRPQSAGCLLPRPLAPDRIPLSSLTRNPDGRKDNAAHPRSRRG